MIAVSVPFVTSVQVRGQPALFVAGEWLPWTQGNLTLPRAPYRIVNGAVVRNDWDPTALINRLGWEQDGQTFLIVTFGFDTARETLLRIAESMELVEPAPATLPRGGEPSISTSLSMMLVAGLLAIAAGLELRRLGARQ